MCNAKRPISFLATSDQVASLKFYEDVLGLDMVEASPYALAFRDGDHMLRVQIVKGHRPPAYTVHGWEIPDIVAEITRLSAQGVVFQTFQHLKQDEHGVWTTEDGNRIAWFKDPSGNILSLTQFA